MRRYDPEDNIYIGRFFIPPPADREPVPEASPVIQENQDIIQAIADKYGVLQRPDDFTGENKNEDIILTPPKKQIKKIDQTEKNKYLPGERLLLTIKKEKPELLENSEYKQISTKKKDRLRNILNRLN